MFSALTFVPVVVTPSDWHGSWHRTSSPGVSALFSAILWCNFRSLCMCLVLDYGTTFPVRLPISLCFVLGYPARPCAPSHPVPRIRSMIHFSSPTAESLPRTFRLARQMMSWLGLTSRVPPSKHRPHTASLPSSLLVPITKYALHVFALGLEKVPSFGTCFAPTPAEAWFRAIRHAGTSGRIVWVKHPGPRIAAQGFLCG